MPTEYLRAAHELRPVIDRNAAIADGAPMLRESVDALARAGLFGIMTPREAGGLELPLREVLDVIAEVAWADGSSAWCLMAGASTAGYFGAYCPDDFVRDAFGPGIPLVAGQLFPNGTAVYDSGGDSYRITGRYQFGSGINHSDWAAVGALTTPAEGSGEQAEMICAMMPIERVTITGNWEVLGLQATASYDYDVTDVAVARSATFKLLTPTRYRGSVVYDLGVLPLTAVVHAAFAIGVVRRALDELVAIARSKHRMGAATALAESDYFLIELGSLEGRFRAAEAWVRESVADLERDARQSETTNPALANAVRQATVHVTQAGADIVRAAYRLAGTSALRKGPLERCFRDIHAGSQHFFASPAPTIDFARDLMAAPGRLASTRRMTV